MVMAMSFPPNRVAAPEMPFPIANYAPHRDALAALLQQPCGQPLLFITGEKDYGKTWLLSWFQTELGDQCRFLKFDLAAPQKLFSPSFIMRKCSEAIGKENFPNFEHEAKVYNRSRVAVVQDVHIRGDNNVVTAEVGTTPQEQLLVALDLTNIFVEDLKKIAARDPPVIFVFDHVDSPGQLISDWLYDGLIPALRSVPHSRLVLAARQLPDFAGAFWTPASKTVTLTGVDDPTAWYSLAKLLKKSFPVQPGADPNVYLEGAIKLGKGVPGTLMPFIQAFPAEAQHA
jgi:hypothetical protein